MASLNVIALISGGKDSLYSLLHCLQNGHKVIALANLYPEVEISEPGKSDPDGEGDDVNSFMYQTVGHSVIPLYAQCLELPLYRRPITGAAVQTGRYYDASEIESTSDEAEDLIPLLQEVKSHHPEANALCSGAILSTYQRTRVESIAIRLGLTPLAYLWQYPALPPPAARLDSLTGLLEDMAAVGCDARIIKIASGGIQEKLLWANVADTGTRSRLVSGLAPFFPGHEFWLRGAVLGEGGEYETLAINGPGKLWKKRIVIDETKSAAITEEGGVHYFKIAAPRVVEKEEDDSSQAQNNVHVPCQLDPQFATVSSQLQAIGPNEQYHGDSSYLGPNDPFTTLVLQPATLSSSRHLAITNLAINQAALKNAGPVTAVEQMKLISQELRNALESYKDKLKGTATTSNIVSTTLLLRDITNFAAINAIYSSLFRPGEPNPPARVTFACELPPGVEVCLSVVLELGSRDSRRGLHVQSRSYWAPANIGPYSQAICEPLDDTQTSNAGIHDAFLTEVVHVAGQIPLIPQTMEVLDGDFFDQAVLSLQHLWRVGQERGTDIWPWGISFLKSHPEQLMRAQRTLDIWRWAHLIGTKPGTTAAGDDDDDDDAGPDAWDLHFNRSAQFQSNISQMTVGDHLHLLPNSAAIGPSSSATFVPPFIAATVTALPRDAPVEWWSVGIANLPKGSENNRQATVLSKSFQWGYITVLSVRAASQAGPQSSQEIEYQQTHLSTILIQTSVDDNLALTKIEQELNNMVADLEKSDRVATIQLQPVHGTAFIAHAGQRVWDGMTRQFIFASLCIVPCSALYGSPATDGGVESSEISDVDVDSARLASQDTDTTCHPLIVAMTLRLLSNPPGSSVEPRHWVREDFRVEVVFDPKTRHRVARSFINPSPCDVSTDVCVNGVASHHKRVVSHASRSSFRKPNCVSNWTSNKASSLLIDAYPNYPPEVSSALDQSLS